MDEPVDLVDRDNLVVGWAPRSKVRRENLLHRGVGVLCCNSRGEVYVHRRTPTKDVFPGMYDMFVGGVVGQGETYRAAAAREVAEELGVREAEPVLLFPHLYEGPENRAWVQIYRVLWDGPVVHQESEIAWGGWLPEQDLEAWAAGVPVVPDGLEIFHRWLRWKAAGGTPEPGWD